MGKTKWMICLIIFLLLPLIWAEKTYKSKRWRLDFEASEPKMISITQPDGQQVTYWYVQYKVINDTERDIPWMINIKLVIDKTKEGVSEIKTPDIFFQGKIPPDQDKEEYINNLMSYYDTNLPVVRKMVLEHLRLYPKLSKNENAVLSALTEDKPKTAIDIMGEVGLSYEETLTALTNLVVNNLSISQEIKESPIFVRASIQKAVFLLWQGTRFTEKEAKVGDTIAGWEIVSFTRNRVVMKKGDVITSFCKGSTLEYLYTKTGKNFVERDVQYMTGMEAKGVYKGRTSGDGSSSKYVFQKNIIAKKSIRHGIAIFSDVSREADYIALVVTGLVDPILHRNRKLFIENEALIYAYQRVGDEFSGRRDPLTELYKKTQVLSLYEVKENGKKEKVSLIAEKAAEEPKFAPVEEKPVTPPPDATKEENFEEEIPTAKEEKTTKTDSDSKAHVAVAKRFLKAQTKEEMLPDASKDLSKLINIPTFKPDKSQLPSDVEFESENQEDQKAKVTFFSKQKKERVTFYLIQEGGEWKVDDLSMPTPRGEMKMKTLLKMIEAMKDKSKLKEMGEKFKKEFEEKKKQEEKDEGE